jgi:hypothetical protein
MKRLWRVVVVLTVMVSIGIQTAPASAGGATFDFHQRWFAPGEHVAGTSQFADGIGKQDDRVADGPYIAYLIRGDRLIEPPRVPGNAIRLGPVRMQPVDFGFLASIRFVVPNVRPGRYTVSLCNDPCRQGAPGDLVGGWIFIAATAEQARIKNLEARIADRVMEGMSQQLSDMSVELERLRAAAAPPSGITVATEMRLNPIEDQLESMSAELRRLRDRSDQGLFAWLWLAGWLVAGSIAAAWWRSASRGRRRLQGSELQPLGGALHLDRVSVSDLS